MTDQPPATMVQLLWAAKGDEARQKEIARVWRFCRSQAEYEIVALWPHHDDEAISHWAAQEADRRTLAHFTAWEDQ